MKKFIIDAEIIYNQVGEFEYKYNVQKYFEDFLNFIIFWMAILLMLNYGIMISRNRLEKI